MNPLLNKKLVLTLPITQKSLDEAASSLGIPTETMTQEQFIAVCYKELNEEFGATDPDAESWDNIKVTISISD